MLAVAVSATHLGSPSFFRQNTIRGTTPHSALPFNNASCTAATRNTRYELFGLAMHTPSHDERTETCKNRCLLCHISHVVMLPSNRHHLRYRGTLLKARYIQSSYPDDLSSQGHETIGRSSVIDRHLCLSKKVHAHILSKVVAEDSNTSFVSKLCSKY